MKSNSEVLENPKKNFATNFNVDHFFSYDKTRHIEEIVDIDDTIYNEELINRHKNAIGMPHKGKKDSTKLSNLFLIQNNSDDNYTNMIDSESLNTSSQSVSKLYTTDNEEDNYESSSFLTKKGNSSSHGNNYGNSYLQDQQDRGHEPSSMNHLPDSQHDNSKCDTTTTTTTTNTNDDDYEGDEDEDNNPTMAVAKDEVVDDDPHDFWDQIVEYEDDDMEYDEDDMEYLDNEDDQKIENSERLANDCDYEAYGSLIRAVHNPDKEANQALMDAVTPFLNQQRAQGYNICDENNDRQREGQQQYLHYQNNYNNMENSVQSSNDPEIFPDYNSQSQLHREDSTHNNVQYDFNSTQDTHINFQNKDSFDQKIVHSNNSDTKCYNANFFDKIDDELTDESSSESENRIRPSRSRRPIKRRNLKQRNLDCDYQYQTSENLDAQKNSESSSALKGIELNEEANNAEIGRIISREFDLEINYKKEEIKIINERIEEASSAWNRLKSIWATKNFNEEFLVGHLYDQILDLPKSKIKKIEGNRCRKTESFPQKPIYCRTATNKFVKLICPDCHRELFGSPLGFLNHCRMVHELKFLTIDDAISKCGHYVDDSVVPQDDPCRRETTLDYFVAQQKLKVQQSTDTPNKVTTPKVKLEPKPNEDQLEISETARSSDGLEQQGAAITEYTSNHDKIHSSNSESPGISENFTRIETPNNSNNVPGESLSSHNTDLIANSRFHIKKKVLVGNTEKPILDSSNNLQSNAWIMYVRGTKEDPNIENFVKKVRFFLHPSFKNPIVEIHQKPFQIQRQSRIAYPVRVQIYLKDPRNKPISVIHYIKFHSSVLEALGEENLVEIDIDRNFTEGMILDNNEKNDTCPNSDVSSANDAVHSSIHSKNSASYHIYDSEIKSTESSLVLNTENNQQISILLKSLITERFPLVSDDPPTEKLYYSYANSYEEWYSWSHAKRKASEWQRAHKLKQIFSQDHKILINTKKIIELTRELNLNPPKVTVNCSNDPLNDPSSYERMYLLPLLRTRLENLECIEAKTIPDKICYCRYCGCSHLPINRFEELEQQCGEKKIVILDKLSSDFQTFLDNSNKWYKKAIIKTIKSRNKWMEKNNLYTASTNTNNNNNNSSNNVNLIHSTLNSGNGFKNSNYSHKNTRDTASIKNENINNSYTVKMENSDQNIASSTLDPHDDMKTLKKIDSNSLNDSNGNINLKCSVNNSQLIENMSDLISDQDMNNSESNSDHNVKINPEIPPIGSVSLQPIDLNFYNISSSPHFINHSSKILQKTPIAPIGTVNLMPVSENIPPIGSISLQPIPSAAEFILQKSRKSKELAPIGSISLQPIPTNKIDLNMLYLSNPVNSAKPNSQVMNKNSIEYNNFNLDNKNDLHKFIENSKINSDIQIENQNVNDNNGSLKNYNNSGSSNNSFDARISGNEDYIVDNNTWPLNFITESSKVSFSPKNGPVMSASPKCIKNPGKNYREKKKRGRPSKNPRLSQNYSQPSEIITPVSPLVNSLTSDSCIMNHNNDGNYEKYKSCNHDYDDPTCKDSANDNPDITKNLKIVYSKMNQDQKDILDSYYKDHNMKEGTDIQAEKLPSEVLNEILKKSSIQSLDQYKDSMESSQRDDQLLRQKMNENNESNSSIKNGYINMENSEDNDLKINFSENSYKVKKENVDKVVSDKSLNVNYLDSNGYKNELIISNVFSNNNNNNNNNIIDNINNNNNNNSISENISKNTFNHNLKNLSPKLPYNTQMNPFDSNNLPIINPFSCSYQPCPSLIPNIMASQKYPSIQFRRPELEKISPMASEMILKEMKSIGIRTPLDDDAEFLLLKVIYCFIKKLLFDTSVAFMEERNTDSPAERKCKVVVPLHIVAAIVENLENYNFLTDYGLSGQ